MKTLLMSLVEAASAMEAGRMRTGDFSLRPTESLSPEIKPIGGEEEVILNWEKDDDAF